MMASWSIADTTCSGTGGSPVSLDEPDVGVGTERNMADMGPTSGSVLRIDEGSISSRLSDFETILDLNVLQSVNLKSVLRIQTCVRPIRTILVFYAIVLTHACAGFDKLIVNATFPKAASQSVIQLLVP